MNVLEEPNGDVLVFLQQSQHLRGCDRSAVAPSEHDLVRGGVLEQALQGVFGRPGLVEMRGVDPRQVVALNAGATLGERDVEIPRGVQVEQVRGVAISS